MITDRQLAFMESLAAEVDGSCQIVAISHDLKWADTSIRFRVSSVDLATLAQQGLISLPFIGDLNRTTIQTYRITATGRAIVREFQARRAAGSPR